MSRTLHFQQITDSRFMDRKNRANFRVKKYTRKVTWNDIFELVNSVKAVPYNFK